MRTGINGKKRKSCLEILLIALLLILASGPTQVKPGILISRGGQFFTILKQMFPPDWSFFGRAMGPLLLTLQMAFAGTLLGAAVGLLAAFFCAEDVNSVGWLRVPLRLLVQLLRTVPSLILALFLTFLTGIGAFSGMAALAVSSFAILAKLGFEDLENIPKPPFYALKQAGCTTSKAAVRALLPELLPSYLTNALYMLEANVRGSAILGYVGAGGIGLLLNEKLSWRQYDKAGMVLLLFFGAVLAAEAAGEYARFRLKEQEKRASLERRDMWWLGLCLAVLVLSLCTIRPASTGGGFRVAGAMAWGLLHPDLALMTDMGNQGLLYLLGETLCIAFVGTMVGTVLAFPLAFLGSLRFVPKPVAFAVRIFTAAVRTVPVFIYGLMFIRVTGPGPFAGALTLGVLSVGLLTKRFQNVLGDGELGGYRALRNAGVPLFPALLRGLWPQIAPGFFGAVLYRFDVNLREASILGLVGAGGIGAPLIMAMNQYKWSQAGALLWGLAAMVLAIGWVSGRIRSGGGYGGLWGRIRKGGSGGPRLNGTALKWLALLSMLTDHIAVVLFARGVFCGSETVIRLFRAIGRLSFPVYCFLLAEGFLHTKNRKKYVLRMLIFAFISEIPFDLAVYDRFPAWNLQNIYFELVILLLVFMGLERSRWAGAAGGFLSGLMIAAGCFSAWILRADYDIEGIFLGTAFYYLCRMAPGNIYIYGESTPKHRRRYFYYWFYPAHLLVLYLIRRFCLTIS